MSAQTAVASRRTSIGSQRNPDSQEAILRAAEDLLLEGGLGAFSIEAVARRAKAGKPTIYRWWPSKAALLLDVYHRQKHDVAYPDTGNVRDDFTHFLGRLFEFWRGGGGAIFRSIIAEAQSDPHAAEALAAYSADRRCHTGNVVRRAQARGEVDPAIDPELVAECLSSFAWTRLLTNRLNGPPKDITAFVDMLLGGIQHK